MYSSYLGPVHVLSCRRHRAMHSLHCEGIVTIDHWVSGEYHAFCSVHCGPAPASADARTAAKGLPAANCAVADNGRWSSYFIKELHFHAALSSAVFFLVLLALGHST